MAASDDHGGLPAERERTYLRVLAGLNWDAGLSQVLTGRGLIEGRRVARIGDGAIASDNAGRSGTVYRIIVKGQRIVRVKDGDEVGVRARSNIGTRNFRTEVHSRLNSGQREITSGEGKSALQIRTIYRLSEVAGASGVRGVGDRNPTGWDSSTSLKQILLN